MTPENAKTVASFLCHGLEHEFATTKKVIGRLPDGKHDWLPHEKGFTAGKLAWHIVTAELWFLQSVANGKFEQPAPIPCPKTSAEIVAFYDQNFPAVIAKVKAMSGEQLAKEIAFHTFNNSGTGYLDLTGKHSIHHRGQLAAYLRAMGEKVPSIYGGSADEPMS